MKKQRNGKLIFNLIVTLLLALIVTGLGKPGFLLRFLKPKEPKVNASAQVARCPPTATATPSISSPCRASASPRKKTPWTGTARSP